MNDPEKKFYNWLRPKFKEWMCDARAIESNVPGLPDLNICRCGTEIWVELKSSAGPPMIRALQYSWGMRRQWYGGRVFVLHEHSNGLAIWRYPFDVTLKGAYVTPKYMQHVIQVSEVPKLCGLLFD